jgi:Pirin
MFGIRFLTASGSLQRSPVASPLGVRHIALLRSGRRNGSITRFITPWDIGELTQPFMYLGHSDLSSGPQTLLGAPPPSGIATLTLVLSGALAFQGASGTRGMLTAGGFQWITRGEMGWHHGGRVSGTRLRAFQLWLALPPGGRNGQSCPRTIRSGARPPRRCAARRQLLPCTAEGRSALALRGARRTQRDLAGSRSWRPDVAGGRARPSRAAGCLRGFTRRHRGAGGRQHLFRIGFGEAVICVFAAKAAVMALG